MFELPDFDFWCFSPISGIPPFISFKYCLPHFFLSSSGTPIRYMWNFLSWASLKFSNVLLLLFWSICATFYMIYSIIHSYFPLNLAYHYLREICSLSLFVSLLKYCFISYIFPDHPRENKAHPLALSICFTTFIFLCSTYYWLTYTHLLSLPLMLACPLHEGRDFCLSPYICPACRTVPDS